MEIKFKNIVIAIGGPPGSGKTTIAKLLAEKLGLRHISIGYLFRKIAQEKGISLEELSRIAQQDPSIDHYLDSMAISEAIKGGVIIDGHVAPWLLKSLAHLRIIVVASPEVRYKRLADRDNKPLDLVARETRAREEIERERFKRYYDIDINDFTDFDIVINTERFTPNDVVELIIKALELKIKKHI